MNRQKAILITILIAALLLFATGFMPAESDKCDCPKEDFAAHGASQTLIDKELSSSEKMPSAGPFGFAKTMTVCMAFDQTNKGYPVEMRLIAEGSVDGRTWFPLTLVGTNRAAETINGCLQVSPTRYVRVGWPPVANVAAPGPRVIASVQVSY